MFFCSQFSTENGFETATSNDENDQHDTIRFNDAVVGQNLAQTTEGQEEFGDRTNVRRSTRVLKGLPSQRFQNIVGLTIQEYSDPRSFDEAMKSSDRNM